MAAQGARSVFISYASPDERIAETVRGRLEAVQVSCWMAPRDIVPGQDWSAAIPPAIEACAVFLLVLSGSASASQQVAREVHLAQARHGQAIIPFRIDANEPGGALAFFLAGSTTSMRFRTRKITSGHSSIGFACCCRMESPRRMQRPATTAAWVTSQWRQKASSDADASSTKSTRSSRNHRLISVGGPGGVGKTRFTTWLASRIGRRFSDGVWFVELGPLQSPDLVVPAIARVLGVSEPVKESLSDTLVSWLASKSVLLLLDNCEHLIDACRAAVARIIAETNEVRVICTTRRWLDLQPEQRYGLAPLTPPDFHGTPTLDDLNASPAAQLLLQRAGQVDSVSLATPAALQAVVDICRRLDGLPLALELAAARTDVLSFEQIADSLNVRLRLLKDRTQQAGARHSTLEAMIRWSYDLLTNVQKTAFRRLGIFPGRFALDAARAVYGSSAPRKSPSS